MTENYEWNTKRMVRRPLSEWLCRFHDFGRARMDYGAPSVVSLQDARVLGDEPLIAKLSLQVLEFLIFPGRRHIRKDRLSGYVDRGHILVEYHRTSEDICSEKVQPSAKEAYNLKEPVDRG